MKDDLGLLEQHGHIVYEGKAPYRVHPHRKAQDLSDT